MNEITPFSFKGNQLRTLTDSQGEPWFVAKDVCDILEIRTNSLRAILEPDEISELSNDNSIDIAQNGGKSPLIISEAGLYSLALKSRKPEAREFKRWVTHEVLPSIRKHGAYATEATIDRILANPDFGIKLLTDLKEERAKRTEAEKTIERQKPLVTIAQEFIQADGTITITDAARYFKQVDPNIKRETVFNVLRAYGYIEQRTNKPTMKAITPGYQQKSGGMHGGKLRTSYAVFTPKGIGWYLSNFIPNTKGEIS